jgi:SAM-dependent methyltransferase
LEPVEYERMDAAEERLWWYRALHANLLDALAQGLAPRGAAILDAGCGTGGLLRRLGGIAPDRARFGLDRLEPVAARARAKSGATVVVGTVDALPFGDASFGAIFSADVLYHREVDPRRAAREALRCLAPGGVLVVNVPAFGWLASYHDRRVHGARRFTRHGLRALLGDAGFASVTVRYWNSLPFPLMVVRRLRPGAAQADSDVSMPPRPVDALLGALMRVERACARLGIRFPAGGSVLAVARK